MNDAELAGRTARLPELFADRLPTADLAGLRSMAGGGEWDELLDLLLTALRDTRTPVTAGERAELCAVMAGWGLPTDQVSGLVVLP